ncbi:MAG: FAD-dependent oxidoreductase [Oscillospiraceae bacterium]|nr:FAD-dependent oxidoreductase [Oscillospiraceae bacterium]
MYSEKYPNLYRALKVKGVVLKNRIMSAPNMLFHTVDGKPTDYYAAYLEHKARGGAAIVNLGEVSVGDGANHTPEMHKTDNALPLFSELAQAIHEHGALASAELTHGGGNVKPVYNKMQPMGPVDTVSSRGDPVRAMTVEDIELVCKQYADTTEYCLHAGFDTVLLHFGHGWLPAQFLSPIINTRTDEFGGSLENRMRFPLMIAKAVRERVGEKQLLMMRISGSERVEGGFTVEDMISFVEQAQEYIDLVEVSAEQMTNFMSCTYLPLGLNTDLSEAIKNSGRVHIPVYSIGAILYPGQAEEIIASGKADGVSMSRALIADPYLPEKAYAGQEEDIIPCVRCLNCTGSDNDSRHFICSVNPLIGREARLGFGEDMEKAKYARKVLVVGGGPAGMQAAVTAAKRGHEVILCEKSDKLGGMLNFTNNDSLKHDLHRYKDTMVRLVEKSGARIMLNTEVTPELAEQLGVDEIIVATGSKPIVPSYLKGIENAQHITEIYANPEAAEGDKIVIIGGGLMGVEAGMHLRNLGKEVTVLELQDDIARDVYFVYRAGLLRKFRELGVTAVTGARCKEVEPGAVVYEKDGQVCRVEADKIFYAVGMTSEDALYFDLEKVNARLSLIGDAKKVGKVDGAVHGGFFAALDIGRL